MVESPTRRASAPLADRRCAVLALLALAGLAFLDRAPTELRATGVALFPFLAAAGLPFGRSPRGGVVRVVLTTWAWAIPPLALALRVDLAAAPLDRELVSVVAIGLALLGLLVGAAAHAASDAGRGSGLHALLWCLFVPGVPVLGLAAPGTFVPRALSPVGWLLGWAPAQAPLPGSALAFVAVGLLVFASLLPERRSAA